MMLRSAETSQLSVPANGRPRRPIWEGRPWLDPNFGAGKAAGKEPLKKKVKPRVIDPGWILVISPGCEVPKGYILGDTITHFNGVDQEGKPVQTKLYLTSHQQLSGEVATWTGLGKTDRRFSPGSEAVCEVVLVGKAPLAISDTCAMRRCRFAVPNHIAKALKVDTFFGR